MARVKTFTNGGSLLPGDLNSIEDDYEFAFSTYKAISAWAGGETGVTPGAFTFVLNPGGGATAAPFPASYSLLYFDPADFLGNTRTTKYRVRAVLNCNAVAPGTTWTFGLYPVTVVNGVSGSTNTFNVGAVVAGSTAAIATPGANSSNNAASADFTAPAAGLYCLAVANSGAAVAGSRPDVHAALFVRQV